MKKMFYHKIFFLLFMVLAVSTAQSLAERLLDPTVSQSCNNETQLSFISDVPRKEVLSPSHSIDTDRTRNAINTDDDDASNLVNTYIENDENQPPYIPKYPSPENQSTDQFLMIYLLWVGGDPDPEDIVTYDVYFGTSNPPPQVVSNQTAPYFVPGVLDYSRTYYWKIVSWDNHGAWAVGPIWHFTTILDLKPPVTTHLIDGNKGNNSWFITDVVITLIATDNESGVNHTYYKFGAGDWFEYTEPIIIHEEDSYSFTYYSIDKVGNRESVQGPVTLRIDQIPPSINITRQHIGLFEMKFIAEVSDRESGVSFVWFAVDGVKQFNDTQEPYEWTWTGIGNHTIMVMAFDFAGNVGIQYIITPVEQTQGVTSVQYQNIQQFLQFNLHKEPVS